MNFKNNLLISARHLKADKTNTFISFIGLVLGLGIVAIVLVFVLNELSYDRSFANRERIYRVLNYKEDNNNTWGNTPFIIGETAKDEFAEVENFVHQYNISNIEIKKNNEYIHEPDIISTESDFFNIFGIKILQGNLSGFDKTEGKILLSKKTSEKYFGAGNPVGQLLNIRYEGQEFQMEVAAIYNDLPQNASIKASLVTSIDFGVKHLTANIKTNDAVPNEKDFRDAWNGIFFTNFLLLKNGVDKNAFEAKLKQLGTKNSSEMNKLALSLQPFSDIYFGSEKIIDNNRKEQGNLSMLVILGFIGTLILVIACINYLNLTSAKAMSQVKTFAIQKVCGARKISIINQMVFESTLISLLALPFAIVATWFSLPFLSGILGKTYSIEMPHQMFLNLSILALVTLATGIISGGLVSVRSTRFGLVNVLKGKKVYSNNKLYARKTAIVFQIAVFISLIATLFLVQKQVRYAFNKDLGFIKEGLIRVPLGDHNLELFKQEISKNPNVLSASGTLWMPPSNNKMYASIPKVSDHNEQVKVNGLFVDYGFAKTMGMKIIMGSDFDKEKNNNGVLVNESAIKPLGLTDILGEETGFGTIVGVVSDFNMYSIHEAIKPMIIGLNPGMSQDIAIRLQTENLSGTIEFLKKTWAKTGGTTAFSFDFTDDILNDLYESDIRFSKTIGLLSVIAIIIASLGLFGLSLLVGKQHMKQKGKG